MLQQALVLGMQECSPAEQDRGTHREPAAGAVSTPGAWVFELCPLEKQLQEWLNPWLCHRFSPL